MTDNEIEAYILEVGYKGSRVGKRINIEKVSKEIEEEEERVVDIANVMVEKGWIRWWTMDPREMEITKEGIEEYERIHEGK